MTKRKNAASSKISRRAVLGATVAIPILGATAGRAKSVGAGPGAFRQNGTYKTVPLTKDTVDYACVQTAGLPVDPAHPQPGLNRNLKRMVTLIDEHAHWAGPADLLSFPESPIAGFECRTPDELRAMAIEVPGKETEVLSAKAREYNMWLTFSCYACDPDWPGHVLMLGVLINSTGEIVAKHWMTPNSRGRSPALDVMTPSVYDVLPRYVEMYGWDEVIPVARSPVGNISMVSAQHDPLLCAALAVKGCEVRIHQATNISLTDGALITSHYNGCFTSLVSNSIRQGIKPGNRTFTDSASGGGMTQIIGPNGKPLAKAMGAHEEIVRTTLPLAAYRKNRRAPKTMQHAAARFYDSEGWG